MSTLKKKISQITELLTLPDVVLEVNRLIESPDTTANDIAKVISNDLALSTKMLKLVNSPFYGFPRQITSINYAVVILGFNAVRNLALTAFVMDIKSINRDGFNSHDYWTFSISCAHVAEFLAEYCGLKDKDNTFIAGLVHDIGVIIMNQYFNEDFTKAFVHAKEKAVLFLEAENELLEYNHIEIGAALLESWNLPEQIVDICKNYLEPEKSKDPLQYIVYLADIICRSLCLGTSGDSSIPELRQDILDHLQIDQEKLPELMRKIVEKTANVTGYMQSNEG